MCLLLFYRSPFKMINCASVLLIIEYKLQINAPVEGLLINDFGKMQGKFHIYYLFIYDIFTSCPLFACCVNFPSLFWVFELTFCYPFRHHSIGNTFRTQNCDGKDKKRHLYLNKVFPDFQISQGFTKERNPLTTGC